MCTQKMRAYFIYWPRKSRFPLNLTDSQTYRRTDISIYRVASLLKREILRGTIKEGGADKQKSHPPKIIKRTMYPNNSTNDGLKI